jgi:hypothetical protein
MSSPAWKSIQYRGESTPEAGQTNDICCPGGYEIPQDALVAAVYYPAVSKLRAVKQFTDTKFEVLGFGFAPVWLPEYKVEVDAWDVQDMCQLAC